MLYTLIVPQCVIFGVHVESINFPIVQVKTDKLIKPDTGKLDTSKGTSSTKTDSSSKTESLRTESSKTETSDSGLNESKTSTSSQASAPDDFVMVELVGSITSASFIE